MSLAHPEVTMLIVDDDTDIRASLRFLFEGAGYRVHEAANGSATLAAMQQLEGPLVVLLDLTMPHMSGFDVLRALAPNTALVQRTCVILLTARQTNFSPEETLLLQRLRVPLVQKPFDIDEVLAVVERSRAQLAP